MLSRARKNPNYDGICFHAQQYAEKYLKARRCEVGIPFAKIHDLAALLEQVLVVEPFWGICRQDLAFLTDFSVKDDGHQRRVRKNYFATGIESMKFYADDAPCRS
ncbi:MAG: hypothetical protein BWK80_10415 [Desulfobacteraceae bacterium IS3]|jgi:hypothetical protein|nr:MAG: hypothetical protein BWK80_10415 [Desulfobacteraceae bacterium IS3]HAO21993.1 hypothetical protein [Desulfobacteraceae bacterium]